MKKFLILFNLFVAAYSLDFYCDFHGYDWNKWGEKYTCHATFVDMSEKDTTVMSITGEHQGQLNDQNVEAVQIHGQTCEYIPRGLMKIFMKMNQLYIFRSDLKYISQNDFKDYTSLKTVSLSRNHLSNIPYDTFEEMTNLEEFSLSFNQLKTIPNLKTMKKLKQLYLFENSIEFLSYDDLSENVNLEVVWMYHNKLKQIESDLIDVLPKLRTALFNNNQCINEDFHNLNYSARRNAAKLKLQSKCGSMFDIRY